MIKRQFTFLASLLAIACLAYGCTTNQQKIAYNTLYTVETTTTSVYDGYVDTVINGQSSITNLPTVSKAYNHFQGAFLLALDAAQFNTNALAPESLVIESKDIINLINTIKGGK